MDSRSPFPPDKRWRSSAVQVQGKSNANFFFSSSRHDFQQIDDRSASVPILRSSERRNPREQSKHPRRVNRQCEKSDRRRSSSKLSSRFVSKGKISRLGFDSFSRHDFLQHQLRKSPGVERGGLRSGETGRSAQRHHAHAEEIRDDRRRTWSKTFRFVSKKLVRKNDFAFVQAEKNNASASPERCSKIRLFSFMTKRRHIWTRRPNKLIDGVRFSFRRNFSFSGDFNFVAKINAESNVDRHRPSVEHGDRRRSHHYFGSGPRDRRGNARRTGGERERTLREYLEISTNSTEIRRR